MFFESDVFGLLYSDAGAVAVENLTSQIGLWVRNSLIHLGAGYLGFHQWHYHPTFQATFQFLFIAYALLQVVQLWTPGNMAYVALDSVWDLAAVAVGICWAWADVVRGVPK